MEKWLCWGTIGVSGFLAVLFLFDLILGIPFNHLNPIVDILAAIASGLVCYLGWDASKDL